MPVLVMSGYTGDGGDAASSRDAAFLQTPFTPTELLKRVRNTLATANGYTNTLPSQEQASA
jgi:DNA-binding response OmpR family regulator